MGRSRTGVDHQGCFVSGTAGRFREDLYYRLNVFPIDTPPLRTHREDIALIAARAIRDLCQRMRRPLLALAPADLAVLEAHDWPGNVREL